MMINGLNHIEITKHPLHQIEYSITDLCNKNCKSCSHFAPLCKDANFVTMEEFIKNVEILHNLLPDIHTFWLTGGEPTLHPFYRDLLLEVRRLFTDCPVGVMTNGTTVFQEKDNKEFWKFIEQNRITYHITTYDTQWYDFKELFSLHNCNEYLSLDVNNTFSNLINITHTDQEVTYEKYKKCGWERLNTFIRNGRIWKCPSVTYIDLFNNYFDDNYRIGPDDYLVIDENLTRQQILDFKDKPSYFCSQCNIDCRFMKRFAPTPSERKREEWEISDEELINYNSLL